jgi:hypothetical protein
MNPYIVRNVISEKDLLLIRKLLNIYNSTVINGGSWSPVSNDNSSYSYFDNNNSESKVKKVLQQFSFGNWGGGVVEFKIKKLLYPLQILHAKVNKYPLGENSESLPSTGYCSRYTLNHIPIGGGYMEPHKDDKNELQELQTLLYLTEKPKHYSTGSLLVQTPNGQFSDDSLDPKMGDVLVFDPGMIHEVTKINSESKLSKYDYNSGRVTAVFVQLKLKTL